MTPNPPEAAPKSIDDSFVDWEGHVFGFGYGTGEPHTVAALKTFLELCSETNGYDYEVPEKELGATVAWLLINILAHADIIEYGTSPRYAWLTAKGHRLKAYVADKTVSQITEILCRDEDYTRCYPGACNCGPNGYAPGRVCPNPFWSNS